MLWLAYVLCFTASAQNLPAASGADVYSREKEAALGAQLAAALRQRATPFEDPVFNGYMERLRLRLSSYLPEPRLSYTFAAIADDMRGAQEPVSFPGGWVFVPARLILETGNEAEFAGMLAHAMAHSAERHGIRAAAPGEPTKHGQIPRIYIGGWYGTGAGGAAIPAGLRQLQSSFEIQADALAAKTLAAAGYDPESLAAYLRRAGAGEERISAFAQVTQQLRPTVFSGRGDEFAHIRDEVRKAFPAPVGKPPSLLNPHRLLK